MYQLAPYQSQPPRRPSPLPYVVSGLLLLLGAVVVVSILEPTTPGATLHTSRTRLGVELATPVGQDQPVRGVLKVRTTSSVHCAPDGIQPRDNPLGNHRVVLTQGYGVGSHAPANVWGGVDLAVAGADGGANVQATLGAPIYATVSGVARVVPNSWPAGNYLAITNAAYKVAYAHLSEYAVANGQNVMCGDLVGYVGATGQASGPHLHYEVWKDGVNVNPLTYGATERRTVRKESLLALVVEDGLYAQARPAVADALHTALRYVSERFGNQASAPFQVALVHDDACALHGLAYTDERQVVVFTCTSIAFDQMTAIAAHEFVHQLAQDRYGPAHLQADLILSEGVATWGAGKYWLGSQPDFRAYVRAQKQRGVYYPLATHYQGLGVEAMNALYYQWASFVEFLISTYGREAFDRLYITGAGAPGSADYTGVYGKPLDALQTEWTAWLYGTTSIDQVQFARQTIANGTLATITVRLGTSTQVAVVSADGATPASDASGDTVWADGGQHLQPLRVMAAAPYVQRDGWTLRGGVNAGFFGARTANEGSVVVDGQVLRVNAGRGVVCLAADGSAQIGLFSAVELAQCQQAWGAGPVVIWQGKIAALDIPYNPLHEDFVQVAWREQVYNGTYPKTVFGIGRDAAGAFLILAISTNLTGVEIGQALIARGVTDALGGDDDTSSQMVWDGQIIRDGQPVPDMVAVYSR